MYIHTESRCETAGRKFLLLSPSPPTVVPRVGWHFSAGNLNPEQSQTDTEGEAESPLSSTSTGTWTWTWAPSDQLTVMDGQGEVLLSVEEWGDMKVPQRHNPRYVNAPQLWDVPVNWIRSLVWLLIAPITCSYKDARPPELRVKQEINRWWTWTSHL